MPTVETPTVSKAGITTSASGERHIPASRRADGSLRKEIRVRPGYRPPEDVEIYKNRTSEAWKNRGSGGVPGAEGLKSEPAPATASKNAKRREARKKAAAAGTEGEDQNGAKASNANGSSSDPKASATASAPVPEAPVDPEVQKEKEAKKLSKKLRQARDLKDRKDKGDALLPEQFEKVIKINELIRQLESLGFDANGERKSET
ncbi:hypothetical protein M011DRAFT_412071 [Sporormia fimetaria CBS 119925]|uniref:WIBG Mago-binding domain-containing protein n=1 Tax=Sporormia fimetaria CBS 119925 TaxID=1340428 RepID=A0A6A6UWP7_9PLEO|nr:hypothetical protein M011DRAFT_412071 [Sporormia fimetaria CBS 119925]